MCDREKLKLFLFLQASYNYENHKIYQKVIFYDLYLQTEIHYTVQYVRTVELWSLNYLQCVLLTNKRGLKKRLPNHCVQIFQIGLACYHFHGQRFLLHEKSNYLLSYFLLFSQLLLSFPILFHKAPRFYLTSQEAYLVLIINLKKKMNLFQDEIFKDEIILG